MREPRKLELGRVNVEGPDMWFDEVKSTTFEVKSGEPLALLVLFRYQEMSPDEETARFALFADVAGKKLGPSTHVIHDQKLSVDDAMGYVDLVIPPVASGTVRGSFRVEARYDKKPWGADADEGEATVFEFVGEFELVSK